MNRFFLISLIIITGLTGLFSCDTDLTVEPQSFDHFIKYYGKDGNQTGVKFDILESGEFIMVGNSRFGGFSKLYVVKADPSGNEIWSREINHLGMDIFANDIIGFQDGTSVVLFTQGGSFVPGDTPGGSVGLLRLDANGEITQEYLYEKDTTNPDPNDPESGVDANGVPLLRKLVASALTYDEENGHFFICGTQTRSSGQSFFSIRLTSGFSRVPRDEWIGFNVSSSAPGEDQMGVKIIKISTEEYGIFLTTEGKISDASFGSPEGNNFGINIFVPGLGEDSTFVVGKSILIGTSRNEFGSDIIRIPGTGSFGMMGTSRQGNDSDLYFAKALFNTTPEEFDFARLVNLGNNFEGKAIAPVSNGNFIVLGEELGLGGRNIVLALLSSGADLLWFRKFGGQSGVGNNDLAGGVKQTPDGNFAFVGTVTLDNQQKMALFKVNANGDLKP